MDIIFHNVRALTNDRRRPLATLVAVQGERIAYVGETADLDGLRQPGTRVVDGAGLGLVPGFIDAHTHLFAYAAHLLSVDCSPAAVLSIPELQAAVRRRAAETPSGQWVRAVGYNEFYLAERRHPTRWDLDEAAPEHPVRLAHRSGHAVVLNSRGLRAVGISLETPDPPEGLIDRAAPSGEPTGILYDADAYLKERVPRLTDAELSDGVRRAMRLYLSQGYTSLQDATYHNGPDDWRTMQRLSASGELPLRVTMMADGRQIDAFLWAGLSFRAGDNRLRLGAAKIMLQEATGALYPSAEELRDLVLRLYRLRWQVAVHAVEERPIAAVADAFAAAFASIPGASDRRLRVEHCSLCPPELLERLVGRDVVVVTQPAFIHHSGERYLAEVPADKHAWLYRCKSFVGARLRPAAGSDAPVAPPSALLGMSAAVTRRAASGQAVAPEETITVQEALEMHTRAAAYAAFEEKERGAIMPGMFADLVLLSADPTSVDADAIKDIRVHMTMIGGKVAWEG
ncbi:MAG: amidohydrolase [Dehalococcoidia bacterium]|nr:amidohydrolase [Dehalococcoidia bacterium]